MNPIRARLVLLTVLVTAAVPVLGADLHVAPAGATYTVIQDAVDAALANDVVKVAAGTYAVGNTRPSPAGYTGPATVSQVVFIDKAITLRGGYTTSDWTNSDPAANPTIIDATGSGRCVFVTGDWQPAVENLTLRWGDASGQGGALWGDAGGGLYADEVGLILTGCEIHDCAADSGAGAFTAYCTAVTVTGNDFHDNQAIDSGAGLFLHSTSGLVMDNLFRLNYGMMGAGGLWVNYQSPIVQDNQFLLNSSDQYGGGVVLYSTGVQFVGNSIEDCSAATGGGIWNSLGSSATIAGNTIRGCSATVSGAGLVIESASSQVTNNFIVGNQCIGASCDGSGILVAGGTPELRHNTIADNAGADAIGLLVLEDYLHNVSSVTGWDNIFSGHNLAVATDVGHSVHLDATLWFGNMADIGGGGATTQGPVVVVGNPMYVDPISGDYHVQPLGAGVDMGIDAGITVDIDGEPRPQGAGFDIGADELNLITPTPTPSPTAPPPDLGVRLDVPAWTSPGDTFFVNGWLDNSGPALVSVPVVFILDVHGEYWFWPSWAYYGPPSWSFDYQLMDVPIGSRWVEVLASLTWPDTGTSTDMGLYFHGAMLNDSMTALRGTMASESWGYGP